MSDLCMYELEDIIWDDLYQTDAHIVLHPSDEHADQNSFGCNNRNSNSINEASTLPSGGIKKSDNSFMDMLPPGGELSGRESILSEKTAAVNDSIGFQHLCPEADNVLSFFDNGGGTDSSDFSYYSWDDLGNFEDVDRMFRSCNSTFGLGTGQENDLGWLSSSDAIGDSDDVLKSDESKSDFKFSCPDSNSQRSMSESEDTSRSNGMTCSTNGYEVQNISSIFKGSSQHGILSFSNRTSDSGHPNGMDNKDKVIRNGQGVESRNVSQEKTPNAAVSANKMIKQMKLANQPENHKDYQNVGRTAFLYATDFPKAGLGPVEAPYSNSLGYLSSDTNFTSPDYSFPSEENSLHPAESVIKSENRIPESVTTKDSYTLNQMQVMGNQTSSLQVISFAVDENGEVTNRPKNIHCSSDGIPKTMDFGAQASMSAIILNEKPINYSDKSHSDGIDIGFNRELDFSVSRDSSVNSGLDDISTEATSFHQLHLVMEQLDLRTKLCIRDSLYRLARSAEIRHQYVKLNGGPIVDKDSMLAEGSTKFPDFVDMETDTNPIDRSIAHLLFHRPADSPILAGRDALSFNLPTPRPIHGSVNISHLMPDVAEVVKQEETTAGTNWSVNISP